MRTAVMIALALGLTLAVSTAAAQEPAQAPDGKTLYAQQCRACHGTTGTPAARMLSVYKTLPTLDSAFLARRSVDSLAAAIRNGVGQMKGFKDKLTAEQITAIASYVRTLGTAAKAP